MNGKDNVNVKTIINNIAQTSAIKLPHNYAGIHCMHVIIPYIATVSPCSYSNTAQLFKHLHLIEFQAGR